MINDIANTMLPAVSIRMKPIIFSTEMVNAIIQGYKTKTRRILNPQPQSFNEKGEPLGKLKYAGVIAYKEKIKCPYGKVGDVLWVRESWGTNGLDYFRYKADFKKDGDGINLDDTGFRNPYGKWKPSIHMPKKACRLFLEITDVKVERLQYISKEDAVNEGITINNKPHPGWYWLENIYNTDSSVYAYECLWKSINGEKSWEQNPFVWVVTFKIAECPKGFC